MRRSWASRRHRTSKYNTIKTEVDGIIFASRLEARRYTELKLLERAGEITKLELQPKFLLEVNDILICTYIADFMYVEAAIQKIIVEDSKGMKTPVYQIKKKLMKAIFNIDILETY